MTDHICRACVSRPVKDATVCTTCADDLARALGDITALVTRPCRHEFPDNTTRCIKCHREALTAGQHGSLPSSIYDTPSGLALLANTRNLGNDLDVSRAHQAVLTRREHSSVTPSSRVFAPRAKLDKAQASLDASLTIWANVIEAEHDHLTNTPPRPRNDHTGHALSALAGWLLHHVEWMRHHENGHEAVTQITTAVAAVERAVDAPKEKHYLGPCWQPDETSPTGECTADLYANAERRDGDTVLCPRCAHQHPIESRREWLREHMHDQLATATEVSRAAAILGLTVTPDRIWQWKARGRITPHGTRAKGRKHLPLYRVGDVLDLALDDPDRRKQSA